MTSARYSSIGLKNWSQEDLANDLDEKEKILGTHKGNGKHRFCTTKVPNERLEKKDPLVF